MRMMASSERNLVEKKPEVKASGVDLLGTFC
jgi:hypothetical protein